MSNQPRFNSLLARREGEDYDVHYWARWDFTYDLMVLFVEWTPEVFPIHTW